MDLGFRCRGFCMSHYFLLKEYGIIIYNGSLASSWGHNAFAGASNIKRIAAVYGRIEMTLRRACGVAAFVMALCAASSPASGDDPFVLYVSPAGNDTAAGTFEAPIRSFERAGEILAAEAPDSDVVIRLRSDQGTYVDYSIVWTYYNPSHTTTFEPFPADTPAVFRGDGADPPPRPFFTLDAARGEPTNLVFKGLRIEAYASRIFYFLGNRENPAGGWNGRNRIVDCMFRNIGNYWSPASPIVYGAITFVNSTDNVIENCVFSAFANANTAVSLSDAREFPEISLDVEEAAEGTGAAAATALPIIGVYVAHHSSRDTIRACTMDSIFGDPVRIRDASNGTLIDQCVFTRAGHNAVCSMWFCDAEYLDCDKVHPECPPCFAVLRNCVAYGDRNCAVPRLFKDLNVTYSRRCAPACGIMDRMTIENTYAGPCP